MSKLNPKGWFTLTGVVLIIANLTPVFGVIAFDWDVFPLLMLFWLENLLIGTFNVARILFAQPQEIGAWFQKLVMIPFFCVHYGMFTFVHGVFLITIFGPDNNLGTVELLSLSYIIEIIQQYRLGFATMALLISHWISFIWNYIGHDEYKHADARALMFKPYSRVVILHFVILGGGFLLTMVNSPVVGLLTLIVLKIGFDLFAHYREHQQAS